MTRTAGDSPAVEVTGVGRESYYRWARAVRGGHGSALERKFLLAVKQAKAEVKGSGAKAASRV